MECQDCGGWVYDFHLERHTGGSKCKVFHCTLCDESMPFLRKADHIKTHRPLNTHNNNPTPLIPGDFTPDPEYEDIYRTFEQHIRPSVRNYRLTGDFNFQLDSFTNEAIVESFQSVYRSQAESFKVAISFSYILKNRETGELVFYWASRNNQLLFDSSDLVTCDADYRKLTARIRDVDLQARVTYPNSKFVFVKATNVVFYVTKLGIPIGAAVDLPEYLKRNRGLISLVRSATNKKKSYTDSKCLFRCLALYNGFAIDRLENETNRLFRVYCEQTMTNPSEFCGIYLHELEQISKIFDVGFNVYQQTEQREAKLIFRTLKQDKILYLNLYLNHFSYIKDFAKYCNTYKCIKCMKIFHRNGNYRRHIKTCDGKTKKLYSSGVFRPNPTIFDDLELHGINVPDDARIYPYRITFDCEVYLSPDTPANTEKVTYSHRHNLVSISVASNVPNFTEPRCFISEGSSKDLVEEFVQYLLEISEASATLLTDQFKEYLEQVEPHKALCSRFETYISQIPVIGFNNAR